MMPSMDSREIVWGEVLRSVDWSRHLSREQRFEFYREIHAMNVLPPEAIFQCMDWEITSVKEDRGVTNPLTLENMEALPSEETYSEWKKVAKAVYREAVSKAGRSLGKEEVYQLGWIFFDDIVRARPLSWRFDFRNPDNFSSFTDPDPGRCWFCGNSVTPKSLIVSLHGSGWEKLFSGGGEKLVGGPICSRCLLDSPTDVAARAANHTTQKQERPNVDSKANLRNRHLLPSLMEKFPSFSMIPGYDAAQALARGCPDPEKIRPGKHNKIKTRKAA